MREFMFALAGYASIFTYIFVMIFGIGSKIQKRFGTEASRKIVHISLFMVWVLIDLFLKNTVHQIIIPICFLILNALSFKLKMFGSIERKQENHFGTVYFAAAITIILTIAYLNPELFPYTGVAVFALTFGDGFAALVGHHTRSVKIYREKSLYGFIACFVATFISVLAFKFIYSLEITILNIAVLSLACAILELVCFGLDNFFITIPIMYLSFILSTSPNPWLYASIYISLAVFVIVFFTKSIDYFGSLASCGVVFCFAYLGGLKSLFYLLGCYFTIFVISFISKKIKNNGKPRKPKTFIQIFANGIMGVVFMYLAYRYTHPIFATVSYIAIAGCFIDSISSDIGVLSKKRPYDFILKRHVDAGISGGVSLLGTMAALVASVVCAFFICYLLEFKWIAILLFTALIFIQTLIDSMLGTLAQAKYVCTVCGKLVERPYHCNESAVYKRGIKLVDNNMVNLISSIITSLIAMAILLT